MFDLEILADLPKEPLIYELGGLIFFSALLGFSHVMKGLLKLVGRRGAWVLPYLGAIMMLAAVGLHAYANLYLDPMIKMGSLTAGHLVYQLRFVALIAMLASSLLTLAGAFVCWLWINGYRRRARVR